MTPTLTLTVDDAAALRALFEEHLSKRRAFVAGACALAPFTACELVVELAGRSHRLAAEVVYVKEDEPGRGAGLSLLSLEGEALEALRVFAFAAHGQRDESDESDEKDAGEEESDLESAGGKSVPPLRMHERIRTLSSAEQHRMAMNGSLSERIALERMYGPSVWETLLKNARITIPEVARIARKGTLPRPLVEAIGMNNAWVAVVDVQRALLSNPRTSTAVILRVLQMMPRRDLLLVQSQTAYPAAVRNAARRMLGG